MLNFENFRKSLTSHAQPMSFQKEIFNSVTIKPGKALCEEVEEDIAHKAIRLHKMEFKWQKKGLPEDWTRWFVKITWTEYNKDENTNKLFIQESLVNAYDIVHSMQNKH